MRLFGFLRPDQRLVDRLDALEKRLAVLEAEQHPARLVEWHELSEKLRRYLARIVAVEGRAKERESEPADDKQGARALLMRTKFGQQGS